MSTFSGVIVPMVTPFNRDADQTINYEAGEQLVEKLIAGGASGIFTFGSNGEFHLCTPDEKIDFSKFVIEKVAGRVPVYVGTGSCSTHDAIEMSKRAEAVGADALSVINPYFMGISDMCYTGLAEGMNFDSLFENLVGIGSIYQFPEDALRKFRVPGIVLGGYGKDFHKHTERLERHYNFDVLPDLYDRLIRDLLK